MMGTPYGVTESDVLSLKVRNHEVSGGTIVSAEFERLVTEFEKFQSKLKRVDEQFANLGQMQEEIKELEVSATSADRSVTVVAGPGGTVKNIELTPEAMRQQPGALSASIMATLQQAVAEAARKQAGVIEQHMGGDMRGGILDQVLGAQAEATGTSVEELRATVEPPRPNRREPDDEDLSQTSVFDSEQEPPQPEYPPSRGSQGDQFLENLFSNDDEGYR